MATHSTRRSFLKTSLACAGSAWAAPQILAQSAKGANDRIRLAWIGLGMQGQSDLSSCNRGCEVVALCDCDSKNSAKPVNQHQKRGAKYYQDFRKMFEEMGDRIDAVGISTPDHIHFPAACMAIHLGKHVFVQKPLTHSLCEARTLTELAASKGGVTQMGNQGHAYEGVRLVKKWYQAGLVGAVKQSHRLVEPAGPQGQRICWPRLQGVCRGTTRPGSSGLGPLDGAGRQGHRLQRAAPSPQLAGLVGFRLRRTRRHGLPHDRLPVLGHGSRPAGERRGENERRVEPDLHPLWFGGELPFPRPRRQTAGDAQVA